MNLDESIMRRVLGLAWKGSGKVSPNPMVGAIILKRGLIVAQGYHRAFGGSHAEIEALKKINFEAEGCTLYANLEPCAHFGKTPPCVHSIIKSGIKEVVIGMIDPNPLVSGKGIQTLRDSGIKVELGVLENECRRLNEAYIKFIKSDYPFVIMKIASTLDGKIALASGKSKWISSIEARSYVHDLRNDVDAVLVGANTVKIDNPALGVRIAKRFVKNPYRIVLDSMLTTSLKSKVYNKKLGGKTMVFTSRMAPPARVKIFRNSGIDVIIKKGSGRHIDVKSVLLELHNRNISSVLVEGGKEIFTSFFKSGLVDKLFLVYGNKIVGGEKSVSSFGQIGVSKLNQAFTLENLSIIKLAEDLIVSGYLK
jgi:diaminohydroxyphosphoribosylaminopyrimidine deaminase / 5-amino-6-(5-phosphoribosylamino)uracil reductase